MACSEPNCKICASDEEEKRRNEQKAKRIAATKAAHSGDNILTGDKMDKEQFVRSLEQYVIETCGFYDNYNEDARCIKDYSSALARKLKEYLGKGQRDKYTEKYFAREICCIFASDDSQIYDYVGDVEEYMEKQWKKLETSSSDRGGKRDMGSSDNLASRVLNTVLDDGAEVATRIAAKQLALSVAEPITAMLIAGLELDDNDSSRAKIAKFLTSDIGLGLVSFGLSFGVKQLPLPELAQNVVENLGRELRLQGEMAVASPVVEMVGAPLRAMLTEKVLALPIPGFAAAKQLAQGKPQQLTNIIDVQVEEVREIKPRSVKKSTKKIVKKVAKKAVKASAKPGIKIASIKDVKENKGSPVINNN